MNTLAPLFLMIVVLMTVTVTLAVSPDASFGCVMLGTEINGDYSTEYLFLGDCR